MRKLFEITTVQIRTLAILAEKAGLIEAFQNEIFESLTKRLPDVKTLPYPIDEKYAVPPSGGRY